MSFFLPYQLTVEILFQIKKNLLSKVITLELIFE